MIRLLIPMLFFFITVNAEVVEKTIAIVNNELILESDLKDLQNRLKKPGLVDDALLFDRTLDGMKKNRKEQLNYLIDEKILSSEVKRLNLSVSMDRVEADIKDKARRSGITQAEMFKIIKDQGLSPEEYKKFLKDSLEKQSLMDAEIISKLRISDEDALNEYVRSNPSNRSSIDEFSVAHIFFNPQKGGGEAAYERAKSVIAKLRNGGNFENLAQQYSEDPNFSAGGSLGTFKSGEFLPEIEAAISSLKENETSQIVKSKMGFHIVKLLNKKLTVDPKFERQKDKIKSELMEASFKRQLRSWMQSKRDEAFIRINEKN